MSLRNSPVSGKKKLEKKFIRFLLPAILAVLIHLSFFGFKKAIPPETPGTAKPKRVMLLPRNSSLPDETKLLAWMNILDPSYFIQPNRKHGFSTTYKAVKMGDAPFLLESNVIKGDNRNEDFLPVLWRPHFERIKDQWEFTPSGINPVNISQFRKNLDFPVWMSEDSIVLPQLFENLEKLKSSIKKASPAAQETVLKVDFFGPNFFPKVMVVHSCGNKDLDTVAMRTLIVKGKLLAINDQDSNESYYITVKWYSKE